MPPAPPARGEPTPAPAAAGSDGGAGLDTAALRRVWPDVLARIFTMRRVTWTFLSQHAQVVDFDGQRLVLGIATVGLANTFRAGNHAELVRQALIDEIGVDVPVEGVPMPEAGASAPTAAPPPPPVRAPEPEPRPEPSSDPWTQPGAPPDFVPSAEERTSSRPSAPPAAPASSRGAPASEAAPAKTASRRSVPAPKPVPAAATVGEPDDAVSEDDENIGTSSSDGRAVVERVLGGQFLGELED